MWYKIVFTLMVSIVLKVVFGQLVVKHFFDIPTPWIITFAILFSVAMVLFEQWRTRKTKTS